MRVESAESQGQRVAMEDAHVRLPNGGAVFDGISQYSDGKSPRLAVGMVIAQCVGEPDEDRLLAIAHAISTAIARSAFEAGSGVRRGCSGTIAWISCTGEAFIAHAGDSSAWRATVESAAQLTTIDARKGTVSFFFGHEDFVDLMTDVQRVQLAPGEWLVLVTDGAKPTAERIAEAIRSRGAHGPEAVAREIVDMALAAGSGDNISVVVIAP